MSKLQPIDITNAFLFEIDNSLPVVVEFDEAKSIFQRNFSNSAVTSNELFDISFTSSIAQTSDVNSRHFFSEIGIVIRFRLVLLPWQNLWIFNDASSKSITTRKATTRKAETALTFSSNVTLGNTLVGYTRLFLKIIYFCSNFKRETLFWNFLVFNFGFFSASHHQPIKPKRPN